MYGKCFTSMYDGTLVEDWRALITFQQMIILCDSDGVVDMTTLSISRRTSIPIEHIEAGIKILESEDQYSRTAMEKGKRVVLIDERRPWGWRIVNHKYYRDLASIEDKREKDRVRIAAKRAAKHDHSGVSQPVAECSEQSQMSPIQDTDTNTLKPLGQKGFDQFWSIYPKKVKKKDVLKKWKARKLEVIADLIISDVENRIKNDQRWKDGFIPDPTTYVNGDRWDDEVTKATNNQGETVEWHSTVSGIVEMGSTLEIFEKSFDCFPDFKHAVTTRYREKIN